jgi:hypothetical protein
MRLFAVSASVGIILLTIPPMACAQDSKTQEHAIAEIKKLGGQVEVAADRPGKPVVAVNLKQTRGGDASLEHLQRLTNVKILGLDQSARALPTQGFSICKRRCPS